MVNLSFSYFYFSLLRSCTLLDIISIYIELPFHMVGKYFVVIFVVFCWISCSSDQKIAAPDTSLIELDYSIVRFDKLLVDLDTNSIVEEFNQLQVHHPAFTELYFSRIIPITTTPGVYNDSFYIDLSSFLKDSRIRFLLDTVQYAFGGLDDLLENDLDGAFKNFNYYFPDFVPPNVYTLISEYAYQQFLFEDINMRDGLGIGLDLYFGRDFPYHMIAPNSPSFSKYITRTFDQDHMVKKCMDVIINDKYGPPPGERLIDQMIHNGKKLFLLKKLLPYTHDSIIMEYTSSQIEWAEQNQEQMWAFFFKEELFYESNMMKINKYINTSPNSPGMPAAAPGRTGNYMGWQIIKAYMKKFPEVSLQELFELKDAQQILDQSRFKPRRS